MSDEKAGIRLMMLAFVLLFTMAWTSIANAQSTTVCTSDTVVGNFGVDADLYANHPSSLNPLAPHDDWFENDTILGPGIGVIGTTAATSVPVGLSAAQFRAIISNPASDRNRTYVQRMAFPPLTPRFVAPGIGYLLLDAVAARDNHTAGSAKDSSCFTSGSDKNGANPNTWSIGTGGVQQKNDLIDAGGHIRREYNFITNDAGDLWGFAFATTRNTSGDAHTDFEIFRTAPEIVGGMLTNTGPDGGHTAGLFNTADGSVAAPGDVLVAVDYANGGTNPQASVRIWIDPDNVDGAGMDTATLNTLPNRPFEFTGVFDGGTGSGTYGYAEIRPLSGSTADCLFWSVTNSQTELGTPWGSLTSQNAAFSEFMDPLQMVEVAINFSAFGLDLNPVQGPCFNLFGSLMVKSRSSGSFTSEMKDFMGPFVFGNFQEVNGEITGGGNLSCQTTSVELCASTTTPGATFTWSVVPGSGGNILVNNDSCIVVDSAGCYVLEVSNPSLATCTTTDTLCVMGTPDTDPPTVNCPGDATYSCIEDVPDCPQSWAEFLAQGGSASDASGIDTSSFSANCGSLIGGECGGTITRVFTVSDNCGNTASCTQTIGVNDNIPPVVTNCPSGGDLGCNPSVIPPADTSAFTATDNCMNIIKSWNDVTTGTCNKMLTRTYTATDSCNNSVTCQQIFTWVEDTQAPTTTCPSGGDLGCNPDAAEYAADDAPTWTDACGTPTSGVIAGTPTSNGCNWSVTHKYWATDACLNTDTCYQTFTWVVDLNAPTAACPSGGDLGCNPLTSEYAADDAPTWTDNCGTPNSGVIAGTPSNTGGCNWSVTHKYWATDACLNTDTCYQTFTWVVDLAPPTAVCPQGGDLGCNPDTSEYAANDAPTWSDACGTPTSGVIAGTPSNTGGCSWSVTHKYWATDACLNTDTCYQTFTWVVDVDAPTAVCPQGGDLGCNPSASEYAADDAPTWSDNCGTPNSGVVAGTPSNTSGCIWSVTHKYWATDACLNTDTCYQTFIWIVDNTPPTIVSCAPGQNLGCNPGSVPPADTSLVQATDNCGGPLVVTVGADIPGQNNCGATLTRIYTVTDACGNTATCSQVFTYTVDNEAPTAVCPSGGNLGCNPDAIEYAANDAPAWSDSCSAFTSGVIAGTPSNTQGCTWSVTHKYWATDACLNTDTCYQTFTWVVDVDAPTAVCPQGGDLGCNPSASEYAADDAPTWSDNCGTPNSGVVAGTPSNTSGCIWSVTHKYWATDACLNTDTCYQTFTWIVDNTPPTIVSCAPGGDLGCNPSNFPPADTSAVQATDNCGGPLTVTAGSFIAAGTPCASTLTRIYTVTDACGNTATCSQVFTYSVDGQAPTAICPQGGDLGCNPLVSEYAADDAPTWSDNCGTPNSGVIAGTPSNTQGCNWSVTHKYWATDACLNTDTCYQTFTWVVDVTPPVITKCAPGNNLGCNPGSVPPADTSAIEATDNCGGPLVVTVGADIPGQTACGASVTRIYTVTDACGNTATCAQVFTYTVDNEAPTAVCPSGGNLGCNPDPIEYAANDAPAWSDSCSAFTSGVIAGVPSNTQGCNWSVTHKYWATDACLNTDTCYQTFTWVVDVDAPTAVCPQGGDLGCNPSASEYAADDAPTWSDACGTPTSGVIAGVPSNTQGCNWSVTHKYWATDACLNTDTCYQTFTWVVDVTPPVFTFCPPAMDLGCNPTAIPPKGEATATDNCGGTPVITAYITPVVKTGCNKTRSRIYVATDACGNTATCEQVYTWVVDTKPPTAVCPQGGDLGCNPDAVEYAANDAPNWTDDCGTPTSGVIAGTPSNTGGCNWSVTHKYWATDACLNTDTCYQTFTWVVDVTPPMFTFCPPAMDLGCNPTAIPPPGEATATDNCGGTPVITAYITPVVKTGCDKTRSRIYVATDACGNTATCEQVYTWRQDTKPPVVNCGKDITVCDGTKVDISPTVTDDCDGNLQANCTRSDGLTLNDPFPVGVTTVTCSATDQCGNTGTCSINVSVIDIPTCSIPAPMDLPVCGTAGYTLSAITSGTDSSTTYTWNVVTNDPLGVPWTITGGQGTSSITYSAGSGVATFTLIITNSANGVNCSSQCELMIACVNDRFCTYTQGFYGNAGGKACNGEDTPHFLAGLLSTPLVIGGNGNTLTLTQADVVSGCFFSRLPSGGWSKPLNGAATCNNPVGIMLKNGTFRNTLLNQTITMGLNLRIPGNGLDSLHLTGVYLTTYASNGVGCDDNSAQPIPGTAQVWQLPGVVINYLGANNTVADLYALANQALAGTYVPGNGDPGLGQIAKALDVLNNAFDECRMLGGFDSKPPSVAQIRELPDVPNYEGITMNAYPNPFNMMASIEFKLDGFDSNVTLDVFTLTGEKVATLYNGHANADETYKVELDGSVLPAGIYVYQLNTGDRVYNDKLVLIK